MALQGDTKQINDVCSQITTERQLYGQSESRDGLSGRNQGGFESPDEDPAALGNNEKAHLSPQPFNDMDKNVPLNNVILGVNMDDTVNQINKGKVNIPERE